MTPLSIGAMQDFLLSHNELAPNSEDSEYQLHLITSGSSLYMYLAFSGKVRCYHKLAYLHPEMCTFQKKLSLQVPVEWLPLSPYFHYIFGW